MTRPLHIGLGAQFDVRDVRSFSGIPFFMARALELRGHRVTRLGPLTERGRYPLGAVQLLYRYALRRQLHRDREPIIVRSFGRQLATLARTARVQALLCPSTIPLSLIKTNVPTAFWVDAVLAGMIDYYPEFTGLSKRTIREGNRLERSALQRASLAIFSSDWAARWAMEAYGADPAKVHVVPYGANIEAAPEDVDAIIGQRPTDRCHLLFLGADWHRKGGDIVLAAAEAAVRQGLPVRLDVVGCRPPVALPDWVTVHGFVSKTTPEGKAALDTLFRRTHFLMLPTRADCSPMAIAELNAYGVPCLASAVGGIPTLIRDGGNGMTFPLEAGHEAYAGALVNLFGDRERMISLARSARAEYEERLNWDVAVEKVAGLLGGLL